MASILKILKVNGADYDVGYSSNDYTSSDKTKLDNTATTLNTTTTTLNNIIEGSATVGQARSVTAKSITSDSLSNDLITKITPINNLTSSSTTQPLSAAQGKQLSTSISSVNTELTSTITKLNRSMFKLEQGTITTAGVLVDSSIRVRTVDFWKTTGGSLTINNSFAIAVVYFYDASGNYKGYSEVSTNDSWVTEINFSDFSDYPYVKFVISKQTGVNISPTENIVKNIIYANDPLIGDLVTVNHRLTELENSSGDTINIDSAISSTSTNPVQNKVIKSYIDSQLGNINTILEEIINQ